MIRKAMILVVLSMLGVAGPLRSTGLAEQLNYRLKWLFNTSVVGDVYADAHGYFSAEGLSVAVKAGGPERDAIRELELGYAQFGVASADQVIRALSKGARVAVLAQIFNINPLQWIYRSEKPPIHALSDLRGRVIGITYGGNDETIMKTLLAKANLTENEVSFFSVRYDFTPFYTGKTDLWPVYRNAQGPILTKKLREGGEAVSFLNPSDFGVNFVANSVVTSERMIRDNPDQVKRFTRALLAAWRDALDPKNAGKALATLEGYDKETAPDIRREQLDITRGMILHPQTGAVGGIDVEAWKQTEAIMLEQKLIPAPVSVDRVLAPRE
ncbi:ABC transporter substrate-binding protein [Desulfococcus sp.]|uniref:ABC transporter substrate-binding protein n=1 Tax=Desulfococcus sp. TaxID=2025834 RepID=UPI003593A50D